MLRSTIEQAIKFSEVDSLRVVWHGHYVRYFEDGREAFGKQYDLGYMDVYANGLAVPLVDLQVNYKKTLEYGDTAIIETNYVDSPAAKLIFDYAIYSARDRSLACTGRSTQVFIDPHTRELQLTIPAFFEVWKRKWGISA